MARSGGGGFMTSVAKGVLAIAIMGVNAFCAAIATQVYKIFTQKWRDGGGSDIPVITTAPGGSGGGGLNSGTRTSGEGGVSPEFLNRYRD